MDRKFFKVAIAAALVSLLVGAGISSAEVFREGNLQLNLDGNLKPNKLPRSGTSPIGVTVGGKISTIDKTDPPKLKTLEIELNRKGKLDAKGLPVCQYDSIQPASTSRALSACRSSLVGKGSFTAEITLTGQDPYRARGTLLAFNGQENGKPVIYGQIYSPRPFATSFVIIFKIKKKGGTFGTSLKADLPQSLRTWGNITGIELNLSRKYSFKGQKRSYLSAGCPAPDGVAIVNFPFVKTTFGFEGGEKISGALKRTCRAK